MNLTRVILESPFKGDNYSDLEANVEYAAACMEDCLIGHGEAPFASHLLYPQCLDDTVPMERELGMEAGFTWGETCDQVRVYIDRGVSRGMREGVRRALRRGAHVQFRSLERAVTPAEVRDLMETILGRDC